MTSDITITRAQEAVGERAFKVEIAPSRVEAAENRAARQYAKRARIPGFRKGKVPVDIIKKRYREAIQEAAIRDLIGESWKAALNQEEDLKPLADPRVKDFQFEEGAPVTFEFLVEVKPELSLDRVAGFTITRKLDPVTDEMVSAQIDELRRQRAPWVPIETGTPAAGDLIQATIATLDGEGGEPTEENSYQLVLGQGQAIPAVEEQIMLTEAGTSRDAIVKFPDDFPDESKRGTSRSIRIRVEEVKRQELPELTDDFAKEAGDFDTVEELRQAVREDLERSAARDADADVRTQLIRLIAEANGVVAPRPMIERVISAYARAYEVPEDQFQKFATEFVPIAEAQVKRELIIDHIASDRGLEATEDDIDQKIAEIATAQGMEPGKVYASLQKSGRLKELERNLTEEKVFSYLMENNTIKDERASA